MTVSLKTGDYKGKGVYVGLRQRLLKVDKRERKRKIVFT
jgi:hypothetical protein